MVLLTRRLAMEDEEVRVGRDEARVRRGEIQRLEELDRLRGDVIAVISHGWLEYPGGDRGAERHLSAGWSPGRPAWRGVMMA